jgi:hypothetical protein
MHSLPATKTNPRIARQPGRASYDTRAVRRAILGIHIMPTAEGKGWKVLTMTEPRILREFESRDEAKHFAETLRAGEKRKIFVHDDPIS